STSAPARRRRAGRRAARGTPSRGPDQGVDAVLGDGRQGLGEGVLVAVEGVFPHGGVVVLVHHFQEPAALAVVVDLDVHHLAVLLEALAQGGHFYVVIVIHGEIPGGGMGWRKWVAAV